MNLECSPYKVNQTPFHKKLFLPTSKSYANRILIIASLCPEPVQIDDLPDSTDVTRMISLLSKIGLKITWKTEKSLVIENSFPECENESSPLVLDTGDGGTTNRFLAAMLCLGKRTYVLRPEKQMLMRPMDELINTASELGVKVQITRENISIQGPVQKFPCDLKIDCSRSTQFASAFALCLARLKVKIIPQNLQSSEAYWKLTEHLITHQDLKQWQVPVDFSSASYPIALAVTMGQVILPQVSARDEFQADASFLEILEKQGANLKWSEDGLMVSESNLKPFDIDISSFPDLAPTLAYLAATLKGVSILRNLEVLSYKESDRALEIMKILDLFCIPYQYEKDGLKIFGNQAPKTPSFVHYQAPPDHRMIMMAYLMMRFFAGGEIENHHHVKKSFPQFFDTMT